MSTLTIRMPADKHERLRLLARSRNVSLNKLMEELSTAALAAFDAETRFRARAALGSPEEALRLLDRLDEQAAGAKPRSRARA
ncbi:MAG: toxin-antitoxin system HicB family antitoxin [Thermoanaerobaculia bacterium]|nr:toxin-antitoxin system HicB family antitoxin [Thermoanaerobaculia bacterium]